MTTEYVKYGDYHFCDDAYTTCYLSKSLVETKDHNFVPVELWHNSFSDSWLIRVCSEVFHGIEEAKAHFSAYPDVMEHLEAAEKFMEEHK